MALRKNSSASAIVLVILLIAWIAQIWIFTESLNKAEEERDAISAREAELAKNLEKLRADAADLRTYIDKMLTDPEFVEMQAKGLGTARPGEIIIREAGN